MRAIAVTPTKAGSAQQLELPKPRLEAGMALMRVLEVGIDGTDTEINNGEYGEAPPGSYVLVIGHEALSGVEAVGGGGEGFAPRGLVGSAVGPPEPCPHFQAGKKDTGPFGNRN